MSLFGKHSLFGTPAYFNGQVYIGGVDNRLQAFGLNNGLLSNSAQSQTSEVFGYPGTTPSISANGTSNGILWAVQKGATAILHTYAASDLARSSTTAIKRSTNAINWPPP